MMIPAVSRQAPKGLPLEDPLQYLSRKQLVEYRRGQVIYNEDQKADGLYLLTSGRVIVSAPASDGSEIVLDIYRADQFFGHTGLLGLQHRGERAVTLERSSAMFWGVDEIEDQIEKHPRLGVALMQVLLLRNTEFAQRIESMANEKTPERVAHILLRFADTLGDLSGDGAVRMPPLTHQTISNCIGTSREIVTFQMNRLRQLGYMRYSRRGIELYCDALRDRLGQGPLE
jgi:CRP-like cAMP-binding protein